MDVARFADGEFKEIVLISYASKSAANVAIDHGIFAIDDCANVVGIVEAIATVKTADPLSIGVSACAGNGVSVVAAVVQQIGDFTFFGNGGVATLNDVPSALKPWAAPASSPVRSSVDALVFALAGLDFSSAHGSVSRTRPQLDDLMMLAFSSLMPNCAARFVMASDCLGSN